MLRSRGGPGGRNLVLEYCTAVYICTHSCTKFSMQPYSNLWLVSAGRSDGTCKMVHVTGSKYTHLARKYNLDRINVIKNNSQSWNSTLRVEIGIKICTDIGSHSMYKLYNTYRKVTSLWVPQLSEWDRYSCLFYRLHSESGARIVPKLGLYCQCQCPNGKSDHP